MSNLFGDYFLTSKPAWLPRGNSAAPALKLKSEGAVSIRPGAGSVKVWVVSMIIAGAVSWSRSATTARSTRGVFDQSTKETRVAADDATAWQNYLARLQRPLGRFSSQHIDGVRTVWNYVQRLNPGIGPPHTAPTAENS